MTILTDISVSRARPDDLPAMVAIARSRGLEEWSLADYQDELQRKDSIILVAGTAEEGIVGFLAGRRVPGESDRTADAEIYNIGVRLERQNEGIGRLLVTGFLSDCKRHRVRNIWLEVRASNEAAIRFYSAHGFVKAALRKRFYRNPVEDALVFRRAAC